MSKRIEWLKDNGGFILIVIVIVGLVSSATFKGWYDTLNDETVIAEGKIINVEYLGTAEGYLIGDALNITFDNGESYLIVTGEDMDFTVNSKFIIKLFWDGDDDYWEIKRMYKVPSED